MNERNAMRCDDLANVAAELALGVLTGRERAEALAHLDQCPACRDTVRQLTTTAEELLDLLPAAEPPAGFDSRVLDGLGVRERQLRAGPGRRPGRGRRLLVAAAVVAAIAGAGLGGWGLRAATSPPVTSPLSSAPLLSAAHQPAGMVYVTNGATRWLFMSVDMNSRNGAVICQLVSADGRVTTIGSFRMTRGYGFWGSPEPSATGVPVRARLISPGGTVLATAILPRN
jgi:hypothetical protein